MALLIKTIDDIKSELTKSSKPVGFVATMGALHEGHISLIETAKKQCISVVVSIFINPLQFGQGEDFEKYPRDLENDLKICNENNVDIVFVPGEKEIYPSDSDRELIQPPEEIREILCGKTRENHFAGVATVVKKLFDIVHPDIAYFGQKDLQQLYIIKWLVKEYNLPVKIISCPTIREKNGLALSSRNKYLTKSQKDIAANLYKSLKLAREDTKLGIFTVHKAIIESLIFLSQIPEIKVEYFEARDKENLSEISEDKTKDFYYLVAARVNGVRLIDNIEVS